MQENKSLLRSPDLLHHVEVFVLELRESPSPVIESHVTGIAFRLTLCVHPVCVQVRQRRLITHVLYRLRWLLIQQATRAPSPPLLAVIHTGVTKRSSAWGRLICTRGVGNGTGDDQGRQFGGIVTCEKEMLGRGLGRKDLMIEWRLIESVGAVSRRWFTSSRYSVMEMPKYCPTRSREKSKGPGRS